MRNCRDIVQQYLDELVRRKYSKSTIDGWRNQLGLFLKHMQQHGLKRFQDIELEHIESYSLCLEGRSVSIHTRDAYLRSIRQFFRYLEDTQQIFTNPATTLILRAPPRLILYVPSVEEIKAVFTRCEVSTPLGLRDRAFLETVYSSGVRHNEALSLNLHDPDLDRGILRVIGKGSKERLVPLGEKAVFWIKLYIRESRPKLLSGHMDELALWLTHDGRRPCSQVFQKMLLEHAQALGFTGITMHSLRRACATHMLARGAHPVIIQELLGHANLSSLSQYLQVSITDLKAMHKRSKPGK